LRCDDHPMHEVTTAMDIRPDPAIRPTGVRGTHGRTRSTAERSFGALLLGHGRADGSRRPRRRLGRDLRRVPAGPPTRRAPVPALRRSRNGPFAAGYACGPPPAGERPQCAFPRRRLLLVATLNASALEQLAVLLLRHPLAPLLDNRAHDYPRSLLFTRCWAAWAHTTYEGPAYPPEGQGRNRGVSGRSRTVSRNAVRRSPPPHSSHGGTREPLAPAPGRTSPPGSPADDRCAPSGTRSSSTLASPRRLPPR